MRHSSRRVQLGLGFALLCFALTGCDSGSQAGSPAGTAPTGAAPGASSTTPATSAGAVGDTLSGQRAVVLREVNDLLDEAVDAGTALGVAQRIEPIAESLVAPLAGTAEQWAQELRERGQDDAYRAELDFYRVERARFDEHVGRISTDPGLHKALVPALARLNPLFSQKGASGG